MCDHGVLTDFPAPEIDPYLVARSHDTFHLRTLTTESFVDNRPRGVIGMVDGEITTTDAGYSDHIDVDKDILKIAVVERHRNTKHVGVGYIKGYGLKRGAVATSISHDSHNIIVVAEDGVSAAEVPLAIAGIMSDEPLTVVNEKLESAKEKAFTAGVSRGIDPFMTLSFMALPVIPTLRITTRGVYDVNSQQYI